MLLIFGAFDEKWNSTRELLKYIEEQQIQVLKSIHNYDDNTKP